MTFPLKHLCRDCAAGYLFERQRGKPMPIRNFKPFKFPEANQPGRRDVQVLHAALKKLRIPVADEEIRRGELGDATKDAIKEFQRRAKLRVDGVIGPKTVARLQSEIAHAFIARSKTRAEDMQPPSTPAARWGFARRGRNSATSIPRRSGFDKSQI